MKLRWKRRVSGTRNQIGKPFPSRSEKKQLPRFLTIADTLKLVKKEKKMGFIYDLKPVQIQRNLLTKLKLVRDKSNDYSGLKAFWSRADSRYYFLKVERIPEEKKVKKIVRGKEIEVEKIKIKPSWFVEKKKRLKPAEELLKSRDRLGHVTRRERRFVKSIRTDVGTYEEYDAKTIPRGKREYLYQIKYIPVGGRKTRIRKLYARSSRDARNRMEGMMFREVLSAQKYSIRKKKLKIPEIVSARKVK